MHNSLGENYYFDPKSILLILGFDVSEIDLLRRASIRNCTSMHGTGNLHECRLAIRTHLATKTLLANEEALNVSGVGAVTEIGKMMQPPDDLHLIGNAFAIPVRSFVTQFVKVKSKIVNSLKRRFRSFVGKKSDEKDDDVPNSKELVIDVKDIHNAFTELCAFPIRKYKNGTFALQIPHHFSDTTGKTTLMRLSKFSYDNCFKVAFGLEMLDGVGAGEGSGTHLHFDNALHRSEDTSGYFDPGWMFGAALRVVLNPGFQWTLTELN